MTNFKWGMLLGAAAFLDLFQFLLDWMVIGLILNPPIDFIVGITLPWYLRSQGVKTDAKRIATWIIGPAIEILTDNLLPVGWITDVGLSMMWDKLDKKLPQLPI